MSKVEKHGNEFCLVAEPAEQLADEAREAHVQDCAILEGGSADSGSLAAILLHLARRLLILEQRR